MAWTHFTDWLEEGDILTYEQWKELIDAVEERLLALCIPGIGWDGDPDPGERTGMYQIIDSKIVTAKVHVVAPWTGTPATRRILDLMDSMSSYFAVSQNSAELWFERDDHISEGYNDMTWHAVDDLGYDPDDFLNEWLSVNFDGLNSWKYWNVCRRLVQIMRYPYAKLTTVGNYEKEENLGLADNLPDGRDDLLAAWPSVTEVGASEGYYAYIFGQYELGYTSARGYRTNTTIAIPDIACFSSYGAKVFVTHYNTTLTMSPEESPLNGPVMQASLGATSGSVETPILYDNGYSDVELDLGTGLSEVGSVAFTCQMRAYDGGSDLGDYFMMGARAEMTDGSIEAPYYGIYLAPTFTHPYEDIA